MALSNVNQPDPAVSATGPEAGSEAESQLAWLERVLPRVMRRLMDSENLDMPLLQLPLAQMRLAQALYQEDGAETTGETMGHLSERLGVRQNALTQAADRLVNHRLAERLSDPNDRRVVRLRLTEQGREWVRERRARRHARFHQLWTLLNAPDREEFLQAVRTLEAAADRLAALSDDPDLVLSTETHRAAPTVEETLSRFTVGAANGAVARIGEKR